MHFSIGCSHLPENSYLLANWEFAVRFSNSSNSLNFEAKINCNIFKPKVPKWGKTCTGLKFDLLHFNGPQSHILSGDTFDGPCISYFYSSFISMVKLITNQSINLCIVNTILSTNITLKQQIVANIFTFSTKLFKNILRVCGRDYFTGSLSKVDNSRLFGACNQQQQLFS